MKRALPLVFGLLLAWVPYRAFFGSEIPVGRDLPFYFYPLKAHMAEAARAGEIPWIDRYRWGGSPLLGSPGAAPFDPLNVLFLLLPLGAAAKVWMLVRLSAGVAGFALFARRRGLSREWSAAAGLLFGLSGPFVSFLPFLGAGGAFSLLPWFAVACERALESPRPRRLAALAAVAALLAVGGAPEFVLYAALLALVLWAERWRRDAAARQAGVLAGAALLAAGLAAPALLSGARVTRHSVRGPEGGITLRAASEMSLPAARLPELAWDGAVADWRVETGAPRRGLLYPYLPSTTPGRVALLLAVLGLASGRRALTPLAVSLLGVLLALGPATPVWPAAATLFPPLLSIRYPEKHLALWGFGALWLAVLGLARAERSLREAHRAPGAAALSLLVLLDREAMARGLMPTGPPSTLSPPVVERFPERAGDVPPPRLFALYNYRRVPMPPQNLAQATRHFIGALEPELGTLHGLGYLFERDLDLLMPQQSFEWVRLLYKAVPTRSPLVARLLRTTGVSTVVDIEEGTGRVRFFSIARPLPPFRLARRVVVDGDGRRLFRRALDEAFDAETAYVTGALDPLPAALSPGRLLSVRDRPDALALRVEAAGPFPAFLLVYRRRDATEEATLDGRPVPVADVLFGFSGLLVPPGRHEVRLRPETASVRIGAFMAALSAISLALLSSRARWR